MYKRQGAIYQIGDLVENINDGTSGEIIRRGTNYVQYTDGENVHKAFLHSIKEAKKITKTKQDPDIKDSPGSEPAKYYAKGVGDKKGMSVSTKKARDAHFTKGAKMDDDNPNAYKPAPGDKDKKTKPSQYTKKFKQMYGEVRDLNEKIKGLENKAKKTGMPYGILKKVYDRGMAAWRTGHRPGTTPQQWAFARVNSFITGGGARKSDADLWKKRK